jgi:sphinganine-1-phosphate aldolase
MRQKEQQASQHREARNLFLWQYSAHGRKPTRSAAFVIQRCMYLVSNFYSHHSRRHRIVPDTAHAAFLKAGEYFKIRIHLVACPAPTYKVDIAAVRRLINPNTILLVGSAPNFPHGIIDDISALSTLATRHSLPLHVDCCLGSFMIAMLSRAGFACEPFDFRLPGVTSISCDTHKYGGAPKGISHLSPMIASVHVLTLLPGNSTVLYRTRALRSYQYFISADWSGGVYASPSIAGSRPGALIAGCWATMMHCGESGYITACRSIITAAKRLESCIRHDPELRADLTVIGDPQVTVVAFTSKTLNIYDVADAMSKRGWHLNSLQNPPGMHVAVTLPIVKAVEELVADLKMVVAEEKEKERERVASGLGRKGMAEGTNSALYGVAGSFPDKRIVRDLAGAFLDTLYKV